MDDRLPDDSTTFWDINMDTPTTEPTTPPVPENLPERQRQLALQYQRNIPGMDWAWCVELARLESLPRSRRVLGALAQARHQLASERAYSESTGGWRHSVNRAASGLRS